MLIEQRAQLDRSILGEHLEPAKLDALLELGELTHLQPGSVLFREGEAIGHIFVLLAGRLNLAMHVPGRGNCHILTLGAGELVAWSAVLADGTMSCTALCVDEAKLLAVDAAKIQAEIKNDPEFGNQFMKMLASALAKRLVATRLQLLDLFKRE